MCPLCKLKHDKNHKIINYDLKDYTCNKNNEFYIRYCKKCNKNICVKCEKEHKNHDNISLGEMIPDNNANDELKIYIDELKKIIDNIIIKLNYIKNNIEIYYNISNIIINNLDKLNYYKLKNINTIINYNKIIIKDIKDIIENNNLQYLMVIYDKMNKKESNYILAEIDIQNEEIDKDIKIINTFENWKMEIKRKDKEDDYKFENEKEIKDNCIIKINDAIIPFSYYYNFNKEGKYIIKYLFKNNLSKADFMFYGCKSFTNIDLSNFDTKNITNMSNMFSGCESLTDIDLSNFNTQNVTNMCNMFRDCKSLTKIKVSDFNTQNVTNICNMFCGCKSLINIDLSNFNIKNVKNMGCLFDGCESLTDIDLSNFFIQNDTNIFAMFSGCNSLRKENIKTSDEKLLNKIN